MRPSRSGLSLKLLGWAEYSRRLRLRSGRNKTGRTFVQPSKARALKLALIGVGKDLV